MKGRYLNGGADQRLWKVLPSTTLSLKIMIKESSPKKFQPVVPNNGFYRFLSAPSAASVDCANNDRVSHGFLFVDSALCTLPTACKPLGEWRVHDGSLSTVHNEALLKYSLFKVILYSHLVLQLELGHFSESSLVHSQLTVHKLQYDF